MFSWAVGVSLVFLLLLIWSALVRGSLRPRDVPRAREASTGRNPAPSWDTSPTGVGPELGASQPHVAERRMPQAGSAASAPEQAVSAEATVTHATDSVSGAAKAAARN